MENNKNDNVKKIVWNGEEIPINKGSIVLLFDPERIEVFQNFDENEKFVDGIPHHVLCASLAIMIATKKKGFEMAMEILNRLEQEEKEEK